MNETSNNLFLEQTWEQFTSQQLFHDKYGISFIFDEDNSDTMNGKLYSLCSQLPQLIKDGNLIQYAEDLRLEKIFDCEDDRKLIQYMSYLLYIVNGYLFSQEQVPTRLPANLAEPLYFISQKLGVKPALGWIQNTCNWEIKDQTKDILDVTNLKCRYTFTGSRDEEVFFLISNSADIRLASNIKELFLINRELHLLMSNNPVVGDINCKVQNKVILNKFDLEQLRKIKGSINIGTFNGLCERVSDALLSIGKQFKEQALALKVMFEFNDPDFYYFTIRKYLQGFSNKQIFPDGLYFEGIDKSFHYEGGSGGNSPTFQIIERALGIVLDGFYGGVQEMMRVGMIEKHKDIIKTFHWHSLIKLFVLMSESKKMKDAYNEAILGYRLFNEKHQYYISYYLEKYIKIENMATAKGTSDVPLKMMREKYKIFDNYMLE
ncbi:hypothetical protein pb186bvf_009129 [Paramecium bursaria]